MDKVDRIISKIAVFKPQIVEFIGTFFLVLTVGLNSVIPEDIAMAPLAIGSILMVMIYMGGHISGGHYNPSVSLGVFLRGGKLTFKELLSYWVSQLLASFFAALITFGTSGLTFAPTPGESFSLWNTFYIEFFYTFALVIVVLSVATTPSLEGNSFYGVAIGFTVVAGAYTTRGVTGAAFNPALVTGAMIVDVFSGPPYYIEYIWIYWLAAFLGSFLASFVYRIINYTEPDTTYTESVIEPFLGESVALGASRGLVALEVEYPLAAGALDGNPRLEWIDRRSILAVFTDCALRQTQ